MKRFAQIGIGTAVLVALAACAGHDGGQVYVSQPEVFTRERLVDDRLQEYNWLEKQLAQSDNIGTTFQGLSDERTLEGFMDSLSLSYGFGGSTSTPGSTSSASTSANGNSGSSSGGSAAGASSPSMPTSLPSGNPQQTAAQESAVDQFNDKEALRDAISARIRDVELDDTHDLRGRTLYTLKFNVSLVPAGREHRKAIVFLQLQPPSAPQLANGAPPKSGTELVGLLNDPNSQTNVLGYNSYRQWVRSLNTDLENETRATEVRLLANTLPSGYLDSVIQLLQRLRENALSISTVLNPTVDTSLKTNVASDPAGDFTKTLNFAINSKITIKAATPDQRQLIKASLTEFLDSTCAALADYQLLTNEERAALFSGKNAKQINESNYLKFAVAAAIWERYYDTWGDGGPRLISLNPINVVLPEKGEAYFTNSMAIPDTAHSVLASTQKSDSLASTRHSNFDDEQANNFANFLQTCQKMEATEFLGQPRILAVTPTEYAQNISDVSAHEDFLDLALSLGAAFKGININNTASYLRQSEKLLNTIQREPLEIGFPVAPDMCGILVGPPFTIDHDDNGASTTDVASFTQVPVRYSFTMDIAVPGWWRYLTFTANYVWVDQAGLTKPVQQDPPATTQPSVQIAGETTTAVNLITDPEAITAALGYYNDRQKRAPQIQLDGAGMESHPTLQATTRAAGSDPVASASTQPSQSPTAAPSEQTIVVRGTDLWRNPKVFVGSRKADTVEVLPDMNGLLAHFSSFPYPATQPSDSVTQDLTVVTTFGADSVRDYVTVYPPSGISKPATPAKSAFASIDEPFIVDYSAMGNASDYLVFNLDKTSTLPLGSTQLQLYVRPHNAPYSEWKQLVPKRPFEYDAGSMTVKLDKSDVFGPKLIADTDPAQEPVLDIDLRMQTTPTQDPQSVLDKSPVEVAWFSDESQRVLHLLNRADGKANYTSTAGVLDAPIQIQIPSPKDPRFVAYPTLASATEPNAAPVTVELKGTDSTYSVEGSIVNSKLQIGQIPANIPPGQFNLSINVKDNNGKQIGIPVDASVTIASGK